MIRNLVEKHTTLRKVTASEFAGACPLCGGDPRTSDRFRVWEDGNDRFWCRQCDAGGDTVEFLRKVEGKKCGEAHQLAGKTCQNHQCEAYGKCSATRDGAAPPRQQKPRAATPAPREEKGDTWQPREAHTPAELWQEKAQKLVEEAHQALLETPAVLAYLQARGLPLEAVKRYRFGWIPQDRYRNREAWGLPRELKKETGKPKMLWIPAGIVIPVYESRVSSPESRVVHRIRIRRTDEAVAGDPPGKSVRYYAIPGSGDDVIILSPERRAHVVIESDLDAYMVDWFAGDVVGTVPLTTCSARPREAAYQVLRNSLCILGALDFEPAWKPLRPGEVVRQGIKVEERDGVLGKWENPGGDNWAKWWQPRFPQGKRWPTPKGKDPGDAYKAGVDIRAWIIAGLPPGLRPAAPVKHKESVCQNEQIDNSVKSSPEKSAPFTKTEVPLPEKAESFTESAPAPSPANFDPRTMVMTITSSCGRSVHWTDKPEELRRLVAEGKIVLTSREMVTMKKIGADPEATKRLLDIKEIYPGCTIEEPHPRPEQQPAAPEHKSGTCYWKRDAA